MKKLFIALFFAALSFRSAHAADEPPAALDHFNFHSQITTISQSHAAFPAPYSGSKSLSPSAEQDTSLTWTLFTGARLWHGAEAYFDPELAGGSGFSSTQGIAGFPNGEIYRVDDPSPKWSLARLYLRQVINLGGETTRVEDDKNQLAGTLEQRHITVILGKFSLNDFLDNLAWSHDPRTQFMNWALMDYGAWDYAADTRGYTWGGVVEYRDVAWAVRLASVLEVASANAMNFDLNYPQARGDNLEFEWDYDRSSHPGIARALIFENHANMGNYRTALAANPSAPDITSVRSMSDKYGLGVSVEKALTETLALFARLSWNDGATETWTFTEIDRSASVGVALQGGLWNRAKDAGGVALIANGLSDAHRDYLAAGGTGFIIGDGALNYAPEEIAEVYYSLHMFEHFDLSGDYQYIQNPAYNHDRGPVNAVGIRGHLEI